MYKSLRLVSPPTLPVVTLDEVKAHLRVDFEDEDSLIQGYIDAAVAYLDGADGVLGRALSPQTWEVTYSGSIGDLPLAPVISRADPVAVDGDLSVRFEAGYPDGVPASIKAAILLHVGSLYHNRERDADGWQPTQAYEALLAPHRRWIG